MDSSNPVIGASGAVYGILLAYGLSYPNRMLYIWGLIPVRSMWLVIIMGAIAFFGLLGKADGISHVTHISGMLIGYVLLKNKWNFSEMLFSNAIFLKFNFQFSNSLLISANEKLIEIKIKNKKKLKFLKLIH